MCSNQCLDVNVKILNFYGNCKKMERRGGVYQVKRANRSIYFVNLLTNFWPRSK